MNRKQIEEFIDASDDEVIRLVDGHDNAFIGISYDCDRVAVYDAAVIMENLTKDGMTDIEAIEFFEYNILGSKFSVGTPIYVNMAIARRQKPGKKKGRKKS